MENILFYNLNVTEIIDGFFIEKILLNNVTVSNSSFDNGNLTTNI
jgi:hypothetical protein